MTDHPITPPPELLKQWEEQWAYEHEPTDVVLCRVFQAGADQELEACCEWVAVESIAAATELRAARRPKPPSLKEQALDVLQRYTSGEIVLMDSGIDTIRRALEQLPE